MRKKKFVGILLVWLMLLFLINTSQIVYADKPYFLLVTDGDTDPESDFVEYIDLWSESGPNERFAQFEWIVDKGGSRGGAPIDQDKPVGGTKAALLMTGSENNLELNIKIYKGGAKNPSVGPEIYHWIIIDGKNSSDDCINVEFKNSITGELISSISLYENDEVNLGLPQVLKFECKMWLL
jgi:hypothetical protein